MHYFYSHYFYSPGAHVIPVAVTVEKSIWNHHKAISYTFLIVFKSCE
jgi:hypothetical protein